MKDLVKVFMLFSNLIWFYMEEWLHHFEHHSEYFIVDIRYLSKVLFRFPGVGKVRGGIGWHYEYQDPGWHYEYQDPGWHYEYQDKVYGKMHREKLWRNWNL